MLTGLMVAGRVGSGIAAELGSMMVTDQIAALRALGTDPIRKLVVPRILAGIVMVPILTVIASAHWHGRRLARHRRRCCASRRRSTGTRSCRGSSSRTSGWGSSSRSSSGFAIVSIGCHVGLRTRGGTQGVGTRDDQRRRRQLGRRHRRRLPRDAAPHRADVLMATEQAGHRPALLDEALGPGGPIIVFDDVWLAFDDKVILRDVSFTLQTGHTKIFLGASGAGKSTILRLILGLLKPDQGRIFVNGEEIDAMHEDDLHGRPRRPRDGLPGGRALRLAHRARERRLQAVRGALLADGQGQCARRGGARLHRARATSSTGCRRSSPAGSGAASRSRGRWRPSRASSCTTSRRPASIRSRR